MRRRFNLSLDWRALAAGILGGAFLVISVPKVLQALRTPTFGPILPYHTTNSYGLSLLRVPNASERIERAFSALPPQQPVAVILPDGDEKGIFLSYLLGYFGWPREVRSFAVTRANAKEELHKIERETFAAIFFCGLEPPPGMQPRIPLGTGLTMIPLAAKPEAPGR